LGPLRILILAVLLYIGYRLIMRSLGKGGATKGNSGGTTRKTEKITDVLVEDPLCHKLVPKQQAIQLEIKGETHYFCSKECSEQFLSEKGEES
jgi:YHS domain-containing protein